MPVGKGIVALVGAFVLALALASAAPIPALAQGSLRLPPLPEAKPDAKPDTKPNQKTEPGPASTPAPAPAAPSASSNGAWPSDATQQVKVIQTLLLNLGLYHNTTNGTLGPATRSAIREFQHNNFLPETGEPSEQLFNELQKKSR